MISLWTGKRGKIIKNEEWKIQGTTEQSMFLCLGGSWWWVVSLRAVLGPGPFNVFVNDTDSGIKRALHKFAGDRSWTVQVTQMDRLPSREVCPQEPDTLQQGQEQAAAPRSGQSQMSREWRRTDWEQSWEGHWGCCGWKAGHSPEIGTCSPERQLYPGLHPEQCGQQGKEGDSAPLLCFGETPLRMLNTPLEPST